MPLRRLSLSSRDRGLAYAKLVCDFALANAFFSPEFSQLREFLG
jgi:hypothetical protein